MRRLFRLRACFVFGVNTDVGKTVIAGGVLRAAAAAADVVTSYYIKPLQTGTAELHDDASFVCAAQRGRGAQVDARTLFSWDSPVSPHVAAEQSGYLVSDDALRECLSGELDEIRRREAASAASASRASSKHSPFVLVETAGGVGSPAPSRTLQTDLYRPMCSDMPVLLVGDGRLGGISVTVTAIESMLLRGYQIASIAMLKDNSGGGVDEYGNADAVREHIRERATATATSTSTTVPHVLDPELYASVGPVRELGALPQDAQEPLLGEDGEGGWYAENSEALAVIYDDCHRAAQRVRR